MPSVFQVNSAPPPSLDKILRLAIEAHASDVHLQAGSPPLFRVSAKIQSSSLPALSAQHCTALAREVLDDRRWSEFQVRRDADLACDVPGVGRFRVNVHYQRQTVALAIRLIAPKIRSLSELLLPECVTRLTTMTHGLILVTGPAGSGKSTTLAAMIDEINRRDAAHIITLEDPVEYQFSSNKSAIEQREIGSDVPDFASGLRHVLRQDPDIIFVGEMRDFETASAAITAAETGHLVLSTLHTAGAFQTVERIIDMYPHAQHHHIRSALSHCLQAVVSQTLLARSDEPGMIPAAEIMICSQAVRTCIRENRLVEIPTIIETGRGMGMQSLDYALHQLVRNGYITLEAAHQHAPHLEKLAHTRVA